MNYKKTYDQIIAIDPGASGGYAIWRRWPDGEEQITCGPMPSTRVDIVQSIDDIMHTEFKNTLFIVEDVPKFIAGMATSPSAMAKLHQQFGFLQGAINAHVYARSNPKGNTCKLILVKPTEWQKRVNAGHKKDWAQRWKAHLKEIACDLFYDLAQKRVVTYKTADALLILAPYVELTDKL